jgi:hypothetical protein
MATKIENGRIFNISAGERPKVLLLGNGIARAFFNGGNWNNLIDNYIKDSTKFEEKSDKYLMPMPLKAEMLSNNKLAAKIKKYKLEIASLPPKTPLDQIYLKELLKLNFDYLLTTNFTYEIECALMNVTEIEIKKIEEMKTEIKNSSNPKPLCRFNKVTTEDSKTYDIWHIHGEPINFSTIALGNEEYCKLVGQYDRWLNNRRKNLKNDEPLEIKSWVDAFVTGDVYILGFGMGLSEMDLWWLLQYKTKKLKKMSNFFGNSTFLEPIHCENDPNPCRQAGFKNEEDCKMQLFDVFGVTVENFGVEITTKEDYLNFYDKALEYLQKKVGNKPKISC